MFSCFDCYGTKKKKSRTAVMPDLCQQRVRTKKRRLFYCNGVYFSHFVLVFFPCLFFSTYSKNISTRCGDSPVLFGYFLRSLLWYGLNVSKQSNDSEYKRRVWSYSILALDGSACRIAAFIVNKDYTIFTFRLTWNG